MKLIVPVLMNIVLAIGIYLLKKKGKFSKLSNIQLQVIIGLCFGAVSAFSSDFGEKYMNVVINVRDAAPITAGLIYGPISGIIAGFIGGGYRALSTIFGSASDYTVVACTISTMVAGISAALLRHFMFDNKRPTITYAVGIAVVLEVFHMLMIFITNYNDANTAFMFVQQCTIPMIIANSVAVGTSVFAVSLISKDFKFKKEKKEKGIADTFQVWLFISIIIAFAVTSIFTFNLQGSMSDKNIQEVFEVSMNDTALAVQQESNIHLLEILEDVQEKYLKDENVDLNNLLSTNDYDLKEINIISQDGFVEKSSDPNNVNFDMTISTQSEEFLTLLNKPEGTSLVQLYGPNGYGLYRKYAGSTLADGRIIQIGYDSEQFHKVLDTFVIEVTRNRHVGANGFLAVCDEKLNIVINQDNDHYGLHISSIGIVPNQEMINKKDATQIYTANVIDTKTNYNEEYIYVFEFVEGYCIIAAMPKSEAMLMRDSSMYLSLFMQVLIFAVLFVLIFYLIKKIIVNNLHKVNENLSEITGGNLNVTVNVRASEEFSSLSDDINSTVSTLKRYIAEAAARIDKELEYAKQIQLSALPTNFPNSGDFTVSADMIAAKEVGGDFYDFYYLDETHVAFLVADVSGKGIPAAMFMMTAKTIIKDLAESGLKVNDIFTRANKKLCENNESGMFVTAWMGILDLDTGVLEYANAGHNPPLVLTNNKEFEYLRTRAGFVLGGMDGIKYRKSEMTLENGNRIFLYTDGVTEATDANKELYGEERLLKFINKNKHISTKNILPKIKENIDEFVADAPQADDITMLIFDYKKEKEQVVSKTFPANDNELSNVLGMLEEELEKRECSMKNITSICVAIEEIFVNISHYAYGKETGDCKLTLKFVEKTRELTIIMEDNGIPFNPLAKKDPDVSLPAEQRDIGGLGIYIVKKTMDSVNYRYEFDTNILTMKKVI